MNPPFRWEEPAMVTDEFLAQAKAYAVAHSLPDYPDRPATAGDPCPNGCAASERWEKFSPELLHGNEDGEVFCPTCWEAFR
jgi:hypothetical protein